MFGRLAPARPEGSRLVPSRLLAPSTHEGAGRGGGEGLRPALLRTSCAPRPPGAPLGLLLCGIRPRMVEAAGGGAPPPPASRRGSRVQAHRRGGDSPGRRSGGVAGCLPSLAQRRAASTQSPRLGRQIQAPGLSQRPRPCDYDSDTGPVLPDRDRSAGCGVSARILVPWSVRAADGLPARSEPTAEGQVRRYGHKGQVRRPAGNDRPCPLTASSRGRGRRPERYWCAAATSRASRSGAPSGRSGVAVVGCRQPAAAPPADDTGAAAQARQSGQSWPRRRFPAGPAAMPQCRCPAVHAATSPFATAATRSTRSESAAGVGSGAGGGCGSMGRRGGALAARRRRAGRHGRRLL